MVYADYFDKQISQGITGSPSRPVVRTFNNTITPSNAITIIDPELDQVWAKGFRTSRAPNSYFDYYFAGQDMKVSVDGIEDDPEFSDLPILELGFSVTQTKKPIYGFWSYTYDAVMRGERVVQGTFSLATRTPDYMRRLLSKAAEARANKQQTYSYYRGLTEDDTNIERYWGQNIDPSLTEAGKNIFSVHPPFSLSITYGIQNLSLSQLHSSVKQQDLWDAYKADTPLATDTNERLVESDPISNANRIVIDACELVSFETGFSPDGAVVTESYGFFARDYVIPPRKTSG